MIKSYGVNEYGVFDTIPQTYAGLYDMCQADMSANVKNNLAQVHQIRPDFKALLYWNMRTVLQTSPEYATILSNGWLLKDSADNRILCDVGYLVDIGNPAYQNWIASFINIKINNLGYDGLFGDNSLSWGAGELFYGSSSTPMNPRTNKAWTDAETRQALIGLHRAIKSAIGSKLLLCNGIFNGERFYWFQNQYEEILSSSPLDGFGSEGGWYPVQDRGAVWMTEQQWLKALGFLIYVQNNFLMGHPERFYVMTCLLGNTAGTPFPLPSGCTQKQLATYAYTSTLLGAKTDQNYLGLFADSTFNTQVMQPLYNAGIGTPTNDYYMTSGTHVYARDFTGGKVLVNPTDQPYSLKLTKNYTTLDGQIVSSIYVAAHTGVILKDGTIQTPTETKVPSLSIVDSYSITNQNDATLLTAVQPSSAWARSAGGQTFTGSAGYKLLSAQFALQKLGNPTGSLVAVLYAMTGTFGTNAAPSGTALATSNPVAMSTIGSMAMYNFTFPQPSYTLGAGHYCIAVQVSSGTSLSGTNCIIIGYDSTAPTHPGNYFIYTGNSWQGYYQVDASFSVSLTS